VAIPDLEKKRKHWQPTDTNALLSSLGLDPLAHVSIIARIDPVPAGGEAVKLAWSSPAPAGLYNCTLYTQENLRTPVQAAHRFQAQASGGELTLLKGFLKFWMSLSCNNGEQSHTSNLIAPL
jgi:hypothetical protein